MNKSISSYLLFAIICINGVLQVQSTCTTTTKCPSQFTYSYNFTKCYYGVLGSLTWNDANSNCAGMGGKLVMPKTDSERAYVASLIPSGSNYTWIGVSWRTVDGTDGYYWLDNTPFTFVCVYSVDTPYSSNPYIDMRRSDACSSNCQSSATKSSICEVAASS